MEYQVSDNVEVTLFKVLSIHVSPEGLSEIDQIKLRHNLINSLLHVFLINTVEDIMDYLGPEVVLEVDIARLKQISSILTLIVLNCLDNKHDTLKV